MRLCYGYWEAPIVKIVEISYHTSDIWPCPASDYSSEFANPRLTVETRKTNRYFVLPISGKDGSAVLREARKNKNNNKQRLSYILTATEAYDAILSLRDQLNIKEFKLYDDNDRLINLHS